MLSGLLNSDNLSQTLRDISQRRRQGVLEVSLGERQLHVQFVQGRIVEVVEVGKLPFDEVLLALMRIGAVPISFKSQGEIEGYRDLFLKINEDAVLEENLFRQAIRHRILDKLYEIEAGSGGFFAFQLGMVEFDREFSPNISVGQLLLDIVALHSDRGRFQTTFPPGKILKRRAADVSSLAEEERIALELIGDGIEVEALRSKCILSAFHFQDALLSLSEHGYLSTGAKSDQKTSKSTALEDLARAFESSFDEAFDEQEEVWDEHAEQAHQNGTASKLNGHAAAIEKPHVSAPTLDAKARLNLLNIRLLQSSWIPNLINLILILSALAAPFLFWKRMMELF